MIVTNMNYITLFSTKIIREGALFHNGLERKVSKELCTYFDKYYYKEIVPEITAQNWWSVYKQYGIDDGVFVSYLEKYITEPLENGITIDNITDEFENMVKNASEGAIDIISQDFFNIDKQIGDCLQRLMKESNEKREREREKKIAERSKVSCLPQIANQNAMPDYYYTYAVESLKNGEGAGNDNNGWIQALYNAAKELSSSDDEGFQLILVLHDKDLGGEYAKKDVFVLDDVSKYISKKNFKVVFFKHTSNDFVRLVKDKGLSSYEVYSKADEAISKNIRTTEIVGKLDNLPYDPSCKSEQLLLIIKELRT